MAGGYVQPYPLKDAFEEEDESKSEEQYEDDSNLEGIHYFEGPIGGGGFIDTTWLYDGRAWSRIKPLATKRDFPSCSLVDLDDGQVIKHLH